MIVDHHEYQVFSNEQLALDAAVSPRFLVDQGGSTNICQGHRQMVCDNSGSYADNVDHWVVVGEWSAAMTDCAAALNGYGIGARYDGWYPNSTKLGSCDQINFIDTWSQQLKDDTRKYVETQLDVFEQKTNGWIFWNFKTEASAEWDLFRLLDAGVFPQPLTSREYNTICS